MEDRTNTKNRDAARVVGGLLLVATGAALFVRNMGYVELPYWLFTWPMILILVGIYSGVKHNFSNTGWIIQIAVGVFFLVNKSIPTLRLEPAFWPLVIAGIGILFIIRPRKKNWRHDLRYLKKNDMQNNFTGAMGSTTSNSTDRDDFLHVDSVFSGVNRTILSKNFQGGRIACVFGGAEIDLTQADITGSVIIKMDVVFGGVKLVIPPHWTVQSQVDGVFHSVDDKRRYNVATGMDPNKTLILKGSAVFGGIEVRSY